MKKKIIRFILSCIPIWIIFTGCGIAQDERNEKKVTDKGLREEQIQILIMSGFDEDRVRRGNITSVEERILEEYDMTKEYLQGKYEEEFEFVNCDTAGFSQSYTTFFVLGSVEEEEPAEVQLEIIDGEYYISDTYYGSLMKRFFEEHLLSQMEKNGKKCNDMELTIAKLFGKEYDKNLFPEEAIKKYGRLNAMGTLCFEVDSLDESTIEVESEKLKELIFEAGFSGTYRLIFVNDGITEENMINVP